MTFLYRFLILFYVLFSGSILSMHAQDALGLTRQMIKKSRDAKTLELYVEFSERFGTKLIDNKAYFKINCTPFKLYYRQDFPKKGIEVMYVSGWNDNQAMVNPNGFPWTSLNLDPYGELMRQNQHHTLFDAGFQYLVDILDFLMKKYEATIDKQITCQGEIKHNGADCYKLVFENPDFKYYAYSVKAGETLTSLARKLKLNDTMILQNNKKVKGYDKISPGMVLVMPNDYAKKMVLYLDKKLMVPRYIEVYDDKGLYEKYNFTQVKINPAFSSDDFSSQNPDYGF